MSIKEKIQNLKPKDAGIFKAILAEFVGSLLLNFFGCLATATGALELIALAFGFSVFIIIQSIGHVSGGHINPAITIGMLVTGNINLIRAIFYVLAQCLGAIVGSSLLDLFIGMPAGVTYLNSEISVFGGLGIEFLLGFVLIYTVFGVYDPNKTDVKPIAALAIGLAVATGHLGAVSYTGSGMNPARSFGSAIVAWDWGYHWIYWVGPISGGIVAALLYKYVFSAPQREQLL